MTHVLLLCAGLAAAKPTTTTSTPTLPVISDVAAATAEADALWAARGDRASLESALARYEAIAAAAPSDRAVGEKLVRGWYFLGDGHETDDKLKLEHWEKSIAFGRRCLQINADYAALLKKGDETEASAARVLGREDVGCLYWVSSALGKWAKASGIGVTLKYLPTVKAWMTRVGELDATYYYNGPDRYWGAYYSAIPSFAGQDLNKSKEFFDRAIAAHPTVLSTHVLLAEGWAVKKQDKASFQKELDWVLAQDPGVVPEIRAEAEAEQRKAKALLAQIDDLFAN